MFTPVKPTEAQAADKASTRDGPLERETFDTSVPVPTPTDAPTYVAEALKALATPIPTPRPTDAAFTPTSPAAAIDAGTGNGTGTTENFPVTTPDPAAPAVMPCMARLDGICAQAATPIPTAAATLRHTVPCKSGEAARIDSVMALGVMGTKSPYGEEVGRTTHPKENKG